MTAAQKTADLAERLTRAGLTVTREQANTLRRAALTLHRWAELECGDGNAHASWAIERDETTGKPYSCIYPHQGSPRRYRIADKEAGALRRIEGVCRAIGAHYYHQTDPRGCALYIAKEPLTDQNYSGAGVAVY